MSTITKRPPIAYSGPGSAIENYFAPQPYTPETFEPKPNENWALFDNNNQQHKQIISLLYQAQWTTEHNGKTIPDLYRLSDFLKSDKSPVQKKLSKMSVAETSKIITALEGIVKSTYKRKKR